VPLSRLEIAAATTDDVDAIVDIGRATIDWHHARYPEEIAPFDSARAREQMLNALDAPRNFVLIAKDDAEIVGLVHFVIVRRNAFGALTAHRFGYVEHIAVRPDRQRQGIGHALMDAVRHRLQREAVTELRANVFESNTTSDAFFAREGFGAFAAVRIARI
jgi:diamine N-acetyltransferase